eukprot:5598239-Pleurochrysis_carterae.AAC.5
MKAQGKGARTQDTSDKNVMKRDEVCRVKLKTSQRTYAKMRAASTNRVVSEQRMRERGLRVLRNRFKRRAQARAHSHPHAGKRHG